MKKFIIAALVAVVSFISFSDTPPEGVELVDLTGSGKGSASSMYTSGWTDGSAATAFDDKFDNRSIYNSQTCDWRWTFNEPTVVNAYKIYAPKSDYWYYDRRMPKNFRFEGKNSGDEDWTTLDTRSDQTTLWSAKEGRYFQCENNTAYDTYRLISTATIEGGSGYSQIAELEFFNVNTGAPKLGNCSLEKTASGYDVTIAMAQNSATVKAIARTADDDASPIVVAGVGEVAEGNNQTVAITGLAADTVYQILAVAENAKGVKTNAVGVVYSGALSLAWVKDAEEYMCMAGEVSVSVASAGAYPLTVNYSVTPKTLGTEGATWEAPQPVTIPAGETSATLIVKPKVDATIAEDIYVTVETAAGNYELASSGVDVKIANLVAPVGWNTWVAPEKGLASTGSNWSLGHAPTSSEKVLFDGNFSNAKCEWDTDATHTVAVWKQCNDFSGTVEFDTEFPTYTGATFPLFTVAGDCEILSGKWSCRGNYNNYGADTESSTSKLSTKRWCLNVAIGGDLTVASGASIDVSGKGFGHPGNQSAPCYGGYIFNNDQSCAPYGSITEPFDPGMGCRSQGDQNKKRSGIGGGAVKLVVTGDIALDGSITAIGNVDLNIVRSGGTGGSIWIDANQISGSGTINASACPPSNFTSDQGVSLGSGGRIAVYTKSALALPRANLVCNGTAYSGTSGSSKTKISSAGTIYIKDPSLSNGILRLSQNSSVATLTSARTAVPLMDAVTTFDAIELAGRVILQIDSDKTLNLPGGLASVTSSATAEGVNGISYRGGTLNIGSGDQTISAWMFEPVSNYTFAANLSLSNYGGVGIIKRNIAGTGDAPIPPCMVSFAVNGDMSIDSTSAVDVGNVVGYRNYIGAQDAGWHAGWTTYYDGGGNSDHSRTKTYGSVFNPQDCGSSPARAFLAGGVVEMTVAGTLTLNGKVTANAPFSDNTNNSAASSGGSVKVSAGKILGSGTIDSCGGAGRYSYAGGGSGGRIMVKLTDVGARIPDTVAVSAQGRHAYAYSVKNTKLGSAGTVYVETADDLKNGGVITISNWPDRGFSDFTDATVFPTTPIVAYNNGDPVDDFKNAKLVVTNNAIAEVSVSALKMKSLDVATGSRLDVYGNTLTVAKASVGGVRLAAGEYDVSAGGAHSTYAALVNTSSSAGKLIVRPVGLRLIVR